MIISAPLLASAVLSQAALAVDNNAAPGGRKRCTSFVCQTVTYIFNFRSHITQVLTQLRASALRVHSFDSVSTQVPPSGKEQAPLSDVPFRNLASGVKIKVSTHLLLIMMGVAMQCDQHMTHLTIASVARYNSLCSTPLCFTNAGVQDWHRL
jgi:hypothetical protein